jgi:polyisoprenoid-binding protein YceI
MSSRISLAAFLLGVCPLTGLAADTYQVDPVHSAIVFRIKHLGIGYAYGRFNDIAGTVVLDDKSPGDSTFQFQVKADSVDTANGKRDAHLKGPDFFNVKEFPTITFKSKEVKLLKAATYEVTGDLTLHGVTKPLTVKLQQVGSGNDPFGKHRTGFECNVTIKRGDFGMRFMPGAVGDDVWLLVGFEAVKD